MTRIASSTKRAFTAPGIDLSNHTLTNPGFIGRVFDDANKLMTDGSFEASVAARYFQIRVADS
jgi:hypothetical protein